MAESRYNIGNLELEEIRPLLWEAMKSMWKGSSLKEKTYMATDDDICLSVILLAIGKKLVEDPFKNSNSHSNLPDQKSKEKIMGIVWEYVNQGILYLHDPSHNIYNITEYGLQVLKAEKPIPHDPEGYLAHLKREIPDIDGVILTYMTEAITTYNHRLYLSATTAIGCASEKAILLLIEAYRGFTPSEKEKTKFSDMSNKTVKRQFEEFQKKALRVLKAT
ncbi:MAG: hypothetical protein LUH03_07525 [Oscillospiraceae bacterium]|nr:hypothetical protein [Oscillospiraceae bacterium]